MPPIARVSLHNASPLGDVSFEYGLVECTAC